MCIVIAGVGTALPTRNELMCCCINNPDGFGYAIVADGGSGLKDLHVEKGMSSKLVVDAFLSQMSALGDTVVAWTFHARIFTHGAVSLANTHPFHVGNDPLTVVAHNGILPVTIAKHDTRSDSRIFAEDYLPAMGGVVGLNSPLVSDVVEGYVYGANSKVVVLTANPDAEYALTIFGESSGHWRKQEIWFSNHSYEPYRTYAGYSPPKAHTNKYNEYTSGGFNEDMADIKSRLLSKGEADEKEIWSRCADVNCGSMVSQYDDYCPTCNCCQMCESAANDCMCYTVSESSRR